MPRAGEEGGLGWGGDSHPKSCRCPFSLAGPASSNRSGSSRAGLEAATPMVTLLATSPNRVTWGQGTKVRSWMEGGAGLGKDQKSGILVGLRVMNQEN